MDDSHNPDPNPFNEDRDTSEYLALIDDIDDIDGDRYFGQAPVITGKPITKPAFVLLPQRCMLWAIAIVTVPTCMVAGFAYQVNYQSLRDAERRTQEIQAVAIADRLNSFVLRQYEDTKKFSQELSFTSGISANKKLSDRQKQPFINRLNQYKNSNQSISSVALYSLQGNLILESASNVPSPKRLNQTTLQKVINFNSPVLNQPVRESDRYLIQFLVPILNPKTQKTQAILTSQIPINAIPKSATANYAIKDLTTDAKGNLFLSVYSPKSASLTDIPAFNSPVSNNIESNLVVVPTRALQGLPDLKWQVALMVDEPSINYSYITVLATCILVLVLAIALITYFAARQLSQGLIQASNAINNIAEGRGSQLSVQGNDEIAQLATNINYMNSKFQAALENQNTKDQNTKNQNQNKVDQLQKLIGEGVEALHRVIRANGEDINSADIEAIAAHLQASLVRKQTEINLLQREQDRLNEIKHEVEKLKAELITSSDRYKLMLQDIADQSQQEMERKNLHIQKLESEFARLKTKMVDLGSQLQALTQEIQLHPQSLSETITTKNAELMAKQIMQIREAIAISAKKAKRLSESSQKISKVVDLIHEISIEANFLAVNAGIKANRERSSDFSNFSDQVGKVANMSVSAMEEMELLCENIQAETREVMSNLELGTSQISEATKLIIEVQADLQTVEAIATDKSKAEFDLFASLKAALDPINQIYKELNLDISQTESPTKSSTESR